jgi:hypothetical protein
MSVDSSLLEVPHVQPVKDPDAYLQAAAQCHFSPETGSRYRLKASAGAGLRPAHRGYDLRGSGPLPQHRRRAARRARWDLAPKGYGSNPPTPLAFETASTTGVLKRVIVSPDWEEQLKAWHVADLLEEPRLTPRCATRDSSTTDTGRRKGQRQ